MPTLRITQTEDRIDLEMVGQDWPRPEAPFGFKLTEQEREDLRWYLEDYLQYPLDPAPRIAARIEGQMADMGARLFDTVFGANEDAKKLWGRVSDNLHELRVEIASNAPATDEVPWELMFERHTGSYLALNAQSFVRSHMTPARKPSVRKRAVRKTTAGPLRVLLATCRPGGGDDVPFRSVAIPLIRALEGQARGELHLEVLRPPTFDQLARALREAKEEGRPYHVLHFDGHGTYVETPADLPDALRPLFLSPPQPGSHGYLAFENPRVGANAQYVDGTSMGRLLVETGVPVLALNACRSAYADAPDAPVRRRSGSRAKPYQEDPHQRVRAFGSLAQEVMNQGVPAVVGMRYNVYVVTAAQFVADLYGALARGRPVGEAVTLGRKQLQADPLRGGVSLQDWPVPVVYEAAPIALMPSAVTAESPTTRAWVDPALPQRPDAGFIGRDETLLALDRAFDSHQVVLLHAYAGSGKSAAAAEFARWYSQTRGVEGPVLYSDFQRHLPLARLLDKIGQAFGEALERQGVHWLALDDAHRREKALEVLKRAPVLWIWDNVEPVEGFPAGATSLWSEPEQREMADFLRAAREGKAKFLLTSRREEQGWLRDLPRRIAVPPMPMRERVELALALAQKRGWRHADLKGWRPLLEFTQGNPLAITVLARQALRDRLRTEGQIRAYVEALRAGAARFHDEASEGRSSSLGAALSHGFQHAFTEEERKRLALLHLFQGVVNVGVLRAMGDPEADWRPAEVGDLTQEAGVALLDRAVEVGLLEGRGGLYRIHPALPWFFRGMFQERYAGREQQAQRAYAEAVANLGEYCHRQYQDGNRDVIAVLAAEEENLLHARRLARASGWWGAVTRSMQGLHALYNHTGRRAEWRRLVEETVPDFVDPASGGPRPGLEEEWGLVAQYRVLLAHEARDWSGAERLQLSTLDWDRRRAAPALALGPETLDGAGRNNIRSLAASLHDLGEVQREQGRPECVTAYQESLSLAKRIGDQAGAAVCAFNLGHAYKNLPALRDLGVAEGWYLRSLKLRREGDGLGRGKCHNQLGHVAAERFRDALAAQRPEEELLRHLNESVGHYQEALRLLPADAVNDLAVAHNGLGNIYARRGDLDQALPHYREAIRLVDRQGDLYGAGITRRSVAAALAGAGRFQDALEWARAALRNFESYGERAAQDIDSTKGLIARIENLAKTKRG